MRSSRDPLGLRRQAQGVVKILTDLPEQTGVTRPVPLATLVTQAAAPWTLDDDARAALYAFLRERVVYLFETRGFDVRNIRAVLHAWPDGSDLVELRQKLEALVQLSRSHELQGVATLFKRVKNISKDVARGGGRVDGHALVDAEERALAEAVAARRPAVQAAAARRDYRTALAEVAALQPVVATFFDKVLVMAYDPGVREARLGLVAALRDLILEIADISEIVEA